MYFAVLIISTSQSSEPEQHMHTPFYAFDSNKSVDTKTIFSRKTTHMREAAFMTLVSYSFIIHEPTQEITPYYRTPGRSVPLVRGQVRFAAGYFSTRVAIPPTEIISFPPSGKMITLAVGSSRPARSSISVHRGPSSRYIAGILAQSDRTPS